MASGAAIGGLIPAILNVAIIGASKNSAQTVGFSCFLISTVISLSCLPLTILLQRNQYFQVYGGDIFLKQKNSSFQVLYVTLSRLFQLCFIFYKEQLQNATL